MKSIAYHNWLLPYFSAGYCLQRLLVIIFVFALKYNKRLKLTVVLLARVSFIFKICQGYNKCSSQPRYFELEYCRS